MDKIRHFVQLVKLGIQTGKIDTTPHQTLFYRHWCLRNNVMITAKDLTKEAPRSLCQRVKGYAVLARMTDKGRATINGTMGEYHFNCALDNMLFSFIHCPVYGCAAFIGHAS